MATHYHRLVPQNPSATSCRRLTFALQHLKELLDGLVPGTHGLLLGVDPQLHLLQGLPQQEELLGLPLVLRVQPAVVLLGGLRHQGQVPAMEGWVLLEQLVEIPLDPELILEGLHSHLEMLMTTRKKKKKQERKTFMNIPQCSEIKSCLRLAWGNGNSSASHPHHTSQPQRTSQETGSHVKGA